MKRTIAFCVILLVGGVSWAIIRSDFTPKHLGEQADVVFAGKLEATANPLEWKLTRSKTIKGKPAAEHIISLAKCKKDHIEDIGKSFRRNGKEPVILFAGTLQREKQAYLHLAGHWLAMKIGAKNRWDVTGYAPDLSGTYAGGTDMLIRMSEYIVKDPDSEVPISANVTWSDTKGIKIGKLGGHCGGMAAVEIGAGRKTHLFVAWSAGDKLFRPKQGKDEWTWVFEDVTAAAGLDTKSRCFTWVDVDRDGLADLISWDGKAVSVQLVDKNGKFKTPSGAWSKVIEADCTGLSACSTDGKPGVLVSTYSAAVLLVADGKKGWKKVTMPAGKGQEIFGRTFPCIVADLNGDGHVDVLQPGEDAGLLWKGKAGGFKASVKINVATGAGVSAAAVGDFNENGALDIFLPGAERNTLWENDGKGKFKEVFRFSGSMSYKCPARSSEAKAMDLNHDGRMDLCLVYPRGDILYHFNRGFRAFGEEGQVRLPGLATEPGQERRGQKAMATGDFNADGSQDLVVLTTDGQLLCYLNDQYDMPGLRLRLPAGVTGPVTVSCWMGDEFPICTGVAAVAGHSPPAYLCARFPGKVKVKWKVPGKGEQVKTIKVGDGPVDVIIGAEGKKAAKKK